MAALSLLPSPQGWRSCSTCVFGFASAASVKATRSSIRASFSRSRNEGEEREAGDENLERYLVDMSLEYESVWDTKPFWCQPWTIVLSGTLAVAASWLGFHFVPLTSAVAVLTGAWWFIFLYGYPRAYEEMIAERRRKTTAGEEDTYGKRM